MQNKIGALLIQFLKSFGYAFKGLEIAFKTQRNFRIHVVAILITSAAGWYFMISSGEWMAIILCIAAVLITELINSAIEELANKLHPEKDPLIGRVKDMAAAAVLVAASAAVLVAFVVFSRRF
jgi:diacylglycerol kinase